MITYEFYLILSEHGGVTSRMKRPRLSAGLVAVPMRVSIPEEWFDRTATRITLHLPGPAVDGAFVQADPPYAAVDSAREEYDDDDYAAG